MTDASLPPETKLFYSTQHQHGWVIEQAGTWYAVPHEEGGWTKRREIEKPADLDPVDIERAQNVLGEVLKLSGRGGWRPNAGRPLTLAHPVGLSIKVEQETKERLKLLAEVTGITVSDLVRGWIEMELNTLDAIAEAEADD